MSYRTWLPVILVRITPAHTHQSCEDIVGTRSSQLTHYLAFPRANFIQRYLRKAWLDNYHLGAWSVIKRELFRKWGQRKTHVFINSVSEVLYFGFNLGPNTKIAVNHRPRQWAYALNCSLVYTAINQYVLIAQLRCQTCTKVYQHGAFPKCFVLHAHSHPFLLWCPCTPPLQISQSHHIKFFPLLKNMPEIFYMYL